MQIWLHVSGGVKSLLSKPQLYIKLRDGRHDAQLIDVIKAGEFVYSMGEYYILSSVFMNQVYLVLPSMVVMVLLNNIIYLLPLSS